MLLLFFFEVQARCVHGVRVAGTVIRATFIPTFFVRLPCFSLSQPKKIYIKDCEKKKFKEFQHDERDWLTVWITCVSFHSFFDWPSFQAEFWDLFFRRCRCSFHCRVDSTSRCTLHCQFSFYNSAIGTLVIYFFLKSFSLLFFERRKKKYSCHLIEKKSFFGFQQSLTVAACT